MCHEDGSVLSPRKWPWQKDTLAFGWLVPRRPFREGPCPSEVRRGLIDKAIPPVWPDGTPAPIDTAFAIKVPAGTEIHTGTVANQGGLWMGGTEQVVVVKPWEIGGVEVVDSWPLK